MRYLRLYLNFLRFSFSKAMEFRIDFWLRFIMDAVYYAVSLGFFKILYLQTNTLAGWTEPQAIICVGGFLVVDALQMTFVANNMWEFPTHVNSGALDYYLVRPVSTLFFVSLRDFAVNSMFNLILAAGILTWALWRYPDPVSFAQVICFCLLLLNGAFLHYIIRLLLILPVFWTHSAQGLHMLFFALGEFMDKPDKIFTGGLRAALLTVVPLSLIAVVPAYVIFEGVSASLLLHVTGVTAFFFALALLIWNRALRVYASASS